MEISVHIFDKICRVCLIQSTELKSLFSKLDGEERTLCDVFTFTANIDIKFEDTLPKQVCSDCESIMCKADAFKRRCHESETLLKNVFQDATASSEGSNIFKTGTIKDEKTDLTQKLSDYGTVVSSVATESNDEDLIDAKNIPIVEFPARSTKDTNISQYDDSKLLIPYEKPVKEEVVNNSDDGNDFLDTFDDSDQYVPAPSQIVQTQKADDKKSSITIRYECYCHMQFLSKEDYKHHLKLEKCSSKTRYCVKCDKQFSTLNSWKVHLRTHRREEKGEIFQCSLCARKFKTKSSLAGHLKRHEISATIKHVCEICKREFKYKAYLDNHLLAAHSRPNGFACDICTQSFLNKIALQTHKKSHENEKKHKCTVCSKSFEMLCTLKEHLRTHTGEKPFLCSECGKGFSQNTNLVQHMRRHQGLKPFKCENCEKRFVSKGELDAHARKHSGAHPFVCDECGNGFTTSSALVKHRRIHTGERPYQCDLCPMRFAASGTLKNHRRTHTGERPFQCSLCEKAFVQRNDLISHIRCHTGERPYICTQCGQSFRKASGLKTHVKLHIKDPVVGVNALLTSIHCTER